MSTRTTRPLRVSVVRLSHGDGLPLPDFATEQAAGMDLYAAVEEPITLDAGRRVLIPTGLAIALPPGFEAQIRPRSGLAARHGITVINAPGTIDADYRGEVCVALVNLGDDPFTIERGTRIAQIVFCACPPSLLGRGANPPGDTPRHGRIRINGPHLEKARRKLKKIHRIRGPKSRRPNSALWGVFV